MESNGRLREAGGASEAFPDLLDSSAGGGVLQGNAPASPADAAPPKPLVPPLFFSGIEETEPELITKQRRC